MKLKDWWTNLKAWISQPSEEEEAMSILEIRLLDQEQEYLDSLVARAKQQQEELDIQMAVLEGQRMLFEEEGKEEW